jgi:hypothetical protein
MIGTGKPLAGDRIRGGEEGVNGQTAAETAAELRHGLRGWPRTTATTTMTTTALEPQMNADERGYGNGSDNGTLGMNAGTAMTREGKRGRTWRRNGVLGMTMGKARAGGGRCCEVVSIPLCKMPTST